MTPEPVILRCEACDARVLWSGTGYCETEARKVCLWCALRRCAPQGHTVEEPPLLRL